MNWYDVALIVLIAWVFLVLAIGLFLAGASRLNDDLDEKASKNDNYTEGE